MLLSFDVGIKNLAYCLFDLSRNDVVEWDVLNVSGITPCEKCKKNAVFFKGPHFVCEKHTQLCPMPPSLKVPIAELRKLAEGVCDPKGKKSELIDQLNKHLKETCWQRLPKETSDLITIGRNIHAQLSKFVVTHVIIENQMSDRMKTIQGMIAQHFIGKGVECIEFVSSANKLKSFQESKSTYAKNKKDGVVYCRETLSMFPRWLDFWDSRKGKKDDLADCFLQGIWFWRNRLTNAYNLKINNEDTQ